MVKRDLFAELEAVSQNAFGLGIMAFSLCGRRDIANLRTNRFSTFSQFCGKPYTVNVVEGVSPLGGAE
jgi:hypothetical protein